MSSYYVELWRRSTQVGSLGRHPYLGVYRRGAIPEEVRKVFLVPLKWQLPFVGA